MSRTQGSPNPAKRPNSEDSARPPAALPVGVLRAHSAMVPRAPRGRDLTNSLFAAYKARGKQPRRESST